MAPTIYLTGEAKSPTNNPITSQWGLFFIGLVVDTETHVIHAVDCTATLTLTVEFVRELLVGRSLLEDDALVESITDRYHGSSQRALAAAVRSAAAKYRDLSAGSPAYLDNPLAVRPEPHRTGPRRKHHDRASPRGAARRCFRFFHSRAAAPSPKRGDHR